MEKPLSDDLDTGASSTYAGSSFTYSGGYNARMSHAEPIINDSPQWIRPSNTSLFTPKPSLNRTSSHLHVYSLISSILLSRDSPNSKAAAEDYVSLLMDLKQSCSIAGIPFGWLLKQPMDLFGDGNNVTPLVFEILRAQKTAAGSEGGWKESSSLLRFLIEETDGKEEELEWTVRKACLRRMEDQESQSSAIFSERVDLLSITDDQGDVGRVSMTTAPSKTDANDLFQYLLYFIRIRRNTQDTYDYNDVSEDAAEYEIMLTEGGRDSDEAEDASDAFTAFISIPTFSSSLSATQIALDKDMRLPSDKRRLVGGWNSFGSPNADGVETNNSIEAYVPIQFLAAQRAWRFDIASNALRLTLLDTGSASSEEVIVDARARVVSTSAPIATPAPPSLFPISSTPSSNNSDVFLLPRIPLTPVSQSGVHSTTLKPCFLSSFYSDQGSEQARGFDDPMMLLNGEDELLVELTVKVEKKRAEQKMTNKKKDTKDKKIKVPDSGYLVVPPNRATTSSNKMASADIGSAAGLAYGEEDWESVFTPSTSSSRVTDPTVHDYDPSQHVTSSNQTAAALTRNNVNTANAEPLTETESDPSETSTETDLDSDESSEEASYDHLLDPEIAPAGWVKASYTGRDEDL